MLVTQNAKTTGQAREAVGQDGRKYLVLPVVALVEGVLNGVRVPADAVEKMHESWNGRPVPIGHPQINGNYVSANRQDIMESVVVGQFWNVSYGRGRLKGEIWVDVAKAEAIADGKRVLEAIAANANIEVSTAYWMESRDELGEYRGKRYETVAETLAPDHLAILLDEKGACSWEDGCGAPRVNADLAEFEDSIMVAFYHSGIDPEPLQKDLPRKATLVPREDLHVTLKYLGKVADAKFAEHDLANYLNDFAKHQVAVTAKTTAVGRFYAEGEQPVWLGVSSPALMQFRERLCRELDSLAGRVDEYGYMPHITLAYVDQDARVDLVPPEPTELAFHTLSLKWGATKYNFQLQGYVEVPVQQEAVMANKDCGCKGHEGDDMTEAAKTPAVNSEEAPNESQAATQVVQPVVPEGFAEFKTFFDSLGGAEGLKTLAEGIKALKTNADVARAGLVDELVANKSVAFTKGELEAMGTETLTKLAQTVRVPDFSGRGAIRTNSGQDSDWEAYVEPQAAKKEAK